MKKIFSLILILLLTIIFTRFDANAQEDRQVIIPVSFTYSSVYWWRGVELNGDGVGVMWPGISVELFGITISYAAGVSEDWITKEDSASEDGNKALTEMDYGISYSTDLDIISLGAGIMYCQWPYYDETDPDAKDPSFWEASLSLGLKTILSPTIELYYDYYVEAHKYTNPEKGDLTEDVPTNEDYYIKLQLSHDIFSTKDGFTFSITTWVGYYNDPYFEMEGWSDAVITLGFSKDYDGYSFTSGCYYGRTLGKDFRTANSGIKNHFWCDFGISYKF